MTVYLTSDSYGRICLSCRNNSTRRRPGVLMSLFFYAEARHDDQERTVPTLVIFFIYYGISTYLTLP